MVQTRSQAKKRHSLKRSVRRVYRKRVKNSTCRNKRSTVCAKTTGCNVARGRKRTYCRKSRNRKSRNRKASLSMKK